MNRPIEIQHKEQIDAILPSFIRGDRSAMLIIREVFTDRLRSFSNAMLENRLSSEELAIEVELILEESFKALAGMHLALNSYENIKGVLYIKVRNSCFNCLTLKAHKNKQ